ncbi:hypothetical protein CANMA_001358 [Candida margitis]|uniref:uncharacterized protein n=1 Tax=Candida margitis TaxID=1775924 RepID=UPI0022277D0E|nr:uncharacterized protein CANMA_001358 [Candida margitis]KAI5969695.1 hypothetical protein CANMA_001358 [Candida margitis]
MSATPELGQRSASATATATVTTTAHTSNQPKSFSDYTTPSPTDEENTTNKPTTREKLTPTNAELLTSLKDFTVDKTKYKHYGHSSSMNSQFLEKIVHMKTPEQEGRSSPCSEKPKVEEEMAHVLAGLPNTIEQKLSSPHNTDVLSELIQLQIEQERTKQSILKKEIGDTALQLFNIAKELNVNADLIPFLFASDSITPRGLNNQINKLKQDPKEVICDLEENSRSVENDMTRFKRKHSDTQLPSFSETAQSIIGSNIVSPLRSPNKTPALVHRRVVSDSSDSTTKGSSPTNSGFLPLSFIVNSKETEQKPEQVANESTQEQQHHHRPQATPAIGQSQSQQHSPSIPPQATSPPPPPHGYQSHFTTPQHIPPPPPPASQVQHLPLPPAALHASNTQPTSVKGASNSGSPHLQKYPIVHPHGYPQGGPNYLPQQYPYFVSTSPPHYNHHAYANTTVIGSPPQQQQLQPSLQVSPHNPHPHHHSSSTQTSSFSSAQQQQHKPQQQHSTSSRHPVPSHQFESSESKKIVFKSVEDETPASKRQKSTKSSGSINFMITTPKNPPARKYNNPHKEK